MKKNNKDNTDNKDAMYQTLNRKSLSSHKLPDDNFITTHKSDAASSDPNVQTRPGYSKEDFYLARDEERLPTDHRDIIKTCQSLYKRIGLIRNLIDLMADFASEGIEIQHPNKAQEKFYQAWASKVDLAGRCHDFMKLLLRDGNVIVYKKLAKLTKPVMREMIKSISQNRNLAQEDVIKLLKEKDNIFKFNIPWKYTFLSPTIAKKLGGDLEKFYGTSRIGIEIDNKLLNAIKNPKTDAEKELISKLPLEIRNLANSKTSIRVVPLNMDRTFVAHYKKDDWDEWATPFLFGIFEDIIFKQKMRQADIAALDGVINVIRLWKLGKSDKDVLPTSNAVNKLLGILENNVGGGVMDIVWDDMIDMEAYYPPVDKILGDVKYKSVNSDIVKGLGIPDALVGGSDSNTRNAQSAFVQLKTLMQRLEYVRGVCLSWVTQELRDVSKAMGFRKPPLVIFGNMSLRDEQAEKKLLISLLDRNIISTETLLNNFGRDFMIELERMKSEEEQRNLHKPVFEKANPFYRPKSVMDEQFQQQLKLEMAKQGGENPNGDQPRDTQFVKPNGRPPGVQDSDPRKPRETKILSSSQYILNQATASHFISEIDKIFDPLFVETNKRRLSAKKKAELEKMKFTILSCMSPTDSCDKDYLMNLLNISKSEQINKINTIYNKMCNKFIEKNKISPGIDIRRIFMISSWSIFHTKNDIGDNNG